RTVRFKEGPFISRHGDNSGCEFSRPAKVTFAQRLSYSKVARRQNHRCGLPLTTSGLPLAAWRRRLVVAIVPTRWHSAQGGLEVHWYRACWKSTARNDALPCKVISMQSEPPTVSVNHSADGDVPATPARKQQAM